MVVYNSTKELLESEFVKKCLPYNGKWWSKYIYHFSHVTNIAKILNDGQLVSRNRFEAINDIQLNDNASGEVITGTTETNKDFVRFYFRPLTPTQYHNEGIRTHEEITELGAHCPVPIFLLFDNSMLDEESVSFTYESLASHYNVEIHNTINELKNAPFEYIYHTGSMHNLDVNMVKKHRHAEVIVNDGCSLRYLSKIICRSVAEANTLINLLTPESYELHKDSICVAGTTDSGIRDIKSIFNTNHFYILSATLTQNQFVLKFNKKDKYCRAVEIYCYDTNNVLITSVRDENCSLGLYGSTTAFNITDKLKGYDEVNIVMKIDGNLVYTEYFDLSIFN